MGIPLRSSAEPLAAPPYTLAPSDILHRLDLSPDADWRLVTLGPIEPSVTPRSVAYPHGRPGATMRQNAGGGGQQRDRILDPLRTADEHRQHLGYRLCLFGLTRRPSVQARYNPTLRLWVVDAVAYKRDGGPCAQWTSELDRPCRLHYHFSGGAVSAAEFEELARCADLILGRHARPGRPSRYADPAWRDIAAAAAARKRDYPSLGWGAIARSYGISVRTLRIYRSDLRRELTVASTPPLQEINS